MKCFSSGLLEGVMKYVRYGGEGRAVPRRGCGVVSAYPTHPQVVKRAVIKVSDPDFCLTSSTPILQLPEGSYPCEGAPYSLEQHFAVSCGWLQL